MKFLQNKLDLRGALGVAFAFCLGLATPNSASAQSNLPPIGGQPAVPFMLIGPDSRANGMGDANTGMAEDLNAVHWACLPVRPPSLDMLFAMASAV